jgi:F-type H+-transporting ATPase subunit alpha
MSDNKRFDKLVESGNPVGEVTAINRFLIRASGLQPINIHALVMFEDGSNGFIQAIFEDYVMILHLGSKNLKIGMMVAMQHHELVTKVGKSLIGRVVSVSGNPLDGKGPITAETTWPVFADAPMLYKRELLDTQLETGITMLDALFPLVRGQRIAVLGDSKVGKSTLVTQIAINQRTSDEIVIYCLIAKRRSDIDSLINQLEANKAMEKSIVVVSVMSESLVLSYLAPYVACSIGEYLWQKADQDTIVIYDDLTSHAQSYREIALLSGTSPGRDSYPGDIFYAHSSLLERAGKLAGNHKTQTTIPLVLTPSGDITAYLPTNIMSITDGQWILDEKIFHETVRPALSIGLSVTRVGGRGQNSRQKDQGVRTTAVLSNYAEALEFSHFGSEMALQSAGNLTLGKNLYEIFNQKPGELYNLVCQQLMIDIALGVNQDIEILNTQLLKSKVEEAASKIKSEDDFDKVRDHLRSLCVGRSLAGAPTPATEEAPPASTEAPAVEAKK